MINYTKDLKYTTGIDYDYDNYGCYGCYGCDTGNDYCRGSQYEGLRVKLNLNRFVEENYKKQTKLTRYCIQKYLQYMDFENEDLWEVNTTGGYYGEEIGSIYFTGYSIKITTNIDQLISMSDADKVNSIMTLEYGDVYKPVNGVTLMKIPVKDIFVPNKGYMGKIEPKEVPDKWPVCVVKLAEESAKLASVNGINAANISNSYYLVDGYHRLKSIKETNKQKIEAIILADL